MKAEMKPFSFEDENEPWGGRRFYIPNRAPGREISLVIGDGLLGEQMTSYAEIREAFEALENQLMKEEK